MNFVIFMQKTAPCDFRQSINYRDECSATFAGAGSCGAPDGIGILQQTVKHDMIDATEADERRRQRRARHKLTTCISLTPRPGGG
jgi:hypothetical protein